MENNSQTEDWATWSKHVLKELERLNASYEKIQKELGEVKEELAVIKNQQSVIGELKQWKKDMDEVVSPNQLNTQLGDLKAEVRSLQTFKIVSTTIWAIIQIIFAVIVAFKEEIFGR